MKFPGIILTILGCLGCAYGIAQYPSFVDCWDAIFFGPRDPIATFVVICAITAAIGILLLPEKFSKVFKTVLFVIGVVAFVILLAYVIKVVVPAGKLLPTVRWEMLPALIK